MKLYQYPKCSTCKNAIKFLKQENIEVEIFDISQKTPTKQELKAMLNSYEGELRRLFNTSGLQYRELNLKDKLPDMTAGQAIDLLAGNGMLIKRPFLINSKGKGLVGFKPTEWSEFCC